MKVYREETPDGILQSLTFRIDEGETPSDFKNAVKSWIVGNFPAMNWEEFVNRLVVFESGRITISMT